jgi:hypothetical protein
VPDIAAALGVPVLAVLRLGPLPVRVLHTPREG